MAIRKSKSCLCKNLMAHPPCLVIFLVCKPLFIMTIHLLIFSIGSSQTKPCFMLVASSISSVKVFFANVSAFNTFTSVSLRRKDISRSHDIEIPALLKQVGTTLPHYNSYFPEISNSVECFERDR